MNADTIVGWTIFAGVTIWGLAEFIRWGCRETDRMVVEALDVEADDWSELSRGDVEWDLLVAAVEDAPLSAESAAYLLRKELDSEALVSAWLEGGEVA